MTRPIVTLTLNPALDVSAHAPDIVPGPKLRCSDVRLDPGGGGVNVSRAISLLGGRSRAVVASGGVTGALLCDLLEAEGVAVDRLQVSGLTRQSFAVTEGPDGPQYRFVMPGPVWSAADREALFACLGGVLVPGLILVVSGSLPPGLEAGDLIEINARAEAAGASVILDTSGPALTGAAAGTGRPVDILRVDGVEANELAGRELTTAAAMADFAGSLIADGRARHAVMGLGARGTLGISEGEAFFCRPPEIETVSAVGAGDSLVGAMAMALAAGESFRRAVRFGTAAAGAAVMTPATALCTREGTDLVLEGVQIEEL